MWYITDPSILESINHILSTSEKKNTFYRVSNVDVSLFKSFKVNLANDNLHDSFQIVLNISKIVRLVQHSNDSEDTGTYIYFDVTISIGDLLKIFYFKDKYENKGKKKTESTYLENKRKLLIDRSLKLDSNDFYLVSGYFLWKKIIFNKLFQKKTIDHFLFSKISLKFNLNNQSLAEYLFDLTNQNFLDQCVKYFFLHEIHDPNQPIYFKEPIDINTFINLIDDQKFIKNDLKSMIFHKNNRQKEDLEKYNKVIITDSQQLDYHNDFKIPPYAFSKFYFTLFSPKIADTLHSQVSFSKYLHNIKKSYKNKPQKFIDHSGVYLGGYKDRSFKILTKHAKKKMLLPEKIDLQDYLIAEQDLEDQPEFCYPIPQQITLETSNNQAELFRYYSDVEALEHCINYDQNSNYSLGQKIDQFNQIGFSRIHKIEKESNHIRYLLVPPGYTYKFTNQPIIYHDFYIPTDKRLPKIVLIELCT